MPDTDPTSAAQPAAESDRGRFENLAADMGLVHLLTPASRVRILAVLLQLRGESANPATIQERAGIGPNAWYDNKDALLPAEQADDADGPHFGVIEQAGNVGNSPMYRARMDDPLTEALYETFDIANGKLRQAEFDWLEPPAELNE